MARTRLTLPPDRPYTPKTPSTPYAETEAGLAAPAAAAAPLALTRDAAAVLEQAVIGGDLSAFTGAQRLAYYRAVCQSLDLNPLTQPFLYIRTDGVLRLYPAKGAAEQLARLHHVTIETLQRGVLAELPGLYCVLVRATTPDGRAVENLGAVPILDANGNTLGGVALANAAMKAITKANRRATLALLGLGMVDESEIDGLPGARYVTVDAHGEILEERDAAPALPAAPATPPAQRAAAPPAVRAQPRRPQPQQPQQPHRPSPAPPPSAVGDERYGIGGKLYTRAQIAGKYVERRDAILRLPPDSDVRVEDVLEALPELIADACRIDPERVPLADLAGAAKLLRDWAEQEASDMGEAGWEPDEPNRDRTVGTSAAGEQVPHVPHVPHVPVEVG